MTLASRAIRLFLACLALSVVVQAAPCCIYPTPPSLPVFRVLVPDIAADRWYACKGVAEEDLGIILSLSVMPTSEEWATPPNYPEDMMRDVLYELIAEDDLPDVAMIPRDLAGEISDRCYVYDLDAYACWIQRPFRHDGVVDGIVLPWASDLVLVFFEPGRHVQLGLGLLNHPVLASLRPPEGCCDWPAPPEPVCVCCCP